jgi:predicted nucleic acid-binding protein
MTILFDTNVVLDVLLKRAPHEGSARWLIDRVETGDLIGVLGATTITTIDYVAGRAIGREKTHRDLRNLFRLFEIAAVNRAVLEAALDSDLADFEDAVLHEAGQHMGVDGIVTRDSEDFSAATVPIYTPPELVELLNR